MPQIYRTRAESSSHLRKFLISLRIIQKKMTTACQLIEIKKGELV